MSKELVDRFYASLSTADGDAMASCYHDDVVFEDPAFGELHGKDAKDMWRMLCSKSKDLTLDYTLLEASDTAATANWIASYTFSSGRPVVNDITATMRFADGKIIDHRDQFDIWKWSRQALGLPGMLLGWSPPLKKKVRNIARGNLAEFQAAS